jgi:hypothetical protein
MKALILTAFIGAIFALVALTNTSASDKPDPTQVKTMDDLFAEVGESVPGFGGFYYDENGVPTVSIADGETASSADTKDAIDDSFGHDYVKGSTVQMISAKYSFLQLKEWYDQVWSGILEMPGAVSTDIDESTTAFPSVWRQRTPE